METRSLISVRPSPPTLFSELKSLTHLCLNFPLRSSRKQSLKSFLWKTHFDFKSALRKERTLEARFRYKAGSGDFIDADCDSGYVPRRKRLAAFVSGGGSNFRSIHEATRRGLIHGDVAVLVTDKPGCGGAEYAFAEGIPVLLFPKTSLGEGLSTVELITSLQAFEIDFLLLAGYLKLIPVELVQAYPKSILNIHPSLLPAFGGKGYYGLKVHKAVIASGARYSGPTIHFVDEHYDTGRILAQRVVPVFPDDTAEELAARILQQEHQLYVEATAALCEDRIVWREDGVPMIQSKEIPHTYS